MAKPYSVVFIHGLAKKPAPPELLKLWMWGLSRGNPMPTAFPPPNEGLDLAVNGIPRFLNYYADVFYGEDYETDLESYQESNEAADLVNEGLDGVEEGLVPPVPVTPREQKFLVAFEAKIAASMALTSLELPAPRAQESGEREIARLVPAAIRAAVIKKAAMEAYYFLFDKEFTRRDGVRFQVRRELRERLLEDLAAAKDKSDGIVLVSHSMGTMVAYDVLRNCPGCPPVDTLITLGSPLGIREVQDELIAPGEDEVDFPAAKVDRWINIYDPLDPICGADPRFANDFKSRGGKSIEDIRESNWGQWRHSITHYLAGTILRQKLREALRVAS